jgi:glycosyltransferase involved in cell wall biosynthesis
MILMNNADLPRVIRSLIYSNFFDHSAGIGNDMRMVFTDLQELKVEYKFTNQRKSHTSAVYKVLRALIIGPKPIPEIDFAYSPQVMPKIYDVPHLVRVHDIFPLTNPEWFKLKSRIYFRLSMKTQMKSYFLFDSVTSKNEFVKFFGQIDSNDFAVMYCKTRDLSRDNFCNNCSGCTQIKSLRKESYVIAVGTIEPRKNYGYLTKNWEHLLQNHNEKVKLYIVGSKGWKTSSLTRKLRSGVKDVVWLEKVCDSSLHKLYSEAMAFISASKGEGFNLPVREALSFGLPVVLSDIDVHRELYNDVGVFFNLNSLESLNNALNMAIDMPSRTNLYDIQKINSRNHSKSILSKAIAKVTDK